MITDTRHGMSPVLELPNKYTSSPSDCIVGFVVVCCSLLCTRDAPLFATGIERVDARTRVLSGSHIWSQEKLGSAGVGGPRLLPAGAVQDLLDFLMIEISYGCMEC